MVSLIPDESLARLEDIFGKQFKQFSKNEVQALVTADIEGAVDNSRMRQICAIHAADVTHLLQGLVAKGALMQEGQGRWSRYRLPETSHSVHKDEGSLHKGSNSLHSNISSLHKANNSIHNPELLAIAALAQRQKRLPPAETEQILLKLCKDRWLTRHELSVIVSRNSESLRQRFLNPMVEHGLLCLRYPDKPNRADQAYTSKGLVKENPASLTKQSAK